MALNLQGNCARMIANLLSFSGNQPLYFEQKTIHATEFAIGAADFAPARVPGIVCVPAPERA